MNRRIVLSLRLPLYALAPFERHSYLIEKERYLSKLLERVAGIEPAYSAWKAAALPLSYTRGSGVGSATGVSRGGGGWIRTSVRIANGFTVRLL